MTETPTRQIKVYQPKKSETIKALTPIVVALISLIGSVVIAFIQLDVSGRVDENHTAAKQSTGESNRKIETLVDQMNNVVIPTMQESIKQLAAYNTELLERIVRLETRLDIAQKQIRRKEIRANIPRLMVKK